MVDKAGISAAAGGSSAGRDDVDANAITAAPDWIEQLQMKMQEDADRFGDEEDAEGETMDEDGLSPGQQEALERSMTLDAEQLREIKAAAVAQGLDLSRVLAEAVVCGLKVSEEVAAEAGVELPGEVAIQEAREEAMKVLQEVDWGEYEEGEEEEVEAVVGEGSDGMEMGSKRGSGEDWQQGVIEGNSSTAAWESGSGVTLKQDVQQQQQPKKRVWGAGLRKAARQRDS
jgi:hypothetical protein